MAPGKWSNQIIMGWINVYMEKLDFNLEAARIKANSFENNDTSTQARPTFK